MDKDLIFEIVHYGRWIKEIGLGPYITIKRYEYEGEQYVVIMQLGNYVAVYKVSEIIKEGI